MSRNEQTPAKVWKEYRKGLDFNNQQNLSDIVETNENFFIGKQWEGVESNGLPTPVFNFLKRITLFTIASIASDNIKMVANTMGGASKIDPVVDVTDVVNSEFETLFENNKIGSLVREFMRNAAVDGDGCTYTYWDAEADTGTKRKGAVVTEIVENTRVFFGNANDRNVQKQPYILISSREMVDDVKDRAKKNHSDGWDSIAANTDSNGMNSHTNMNDKVTVVLKLWRNKDTNTIWGYETSESIEVRKAWDTGLKLYPVTWINWDYVADSYHGQAMITGLIPNQIFINKLFAMSMISLMTTAYPKIVYDKTRVPKWDNRVGASIGVLGDVNGAADIIDPAQISPQIAQFIELAVNYTQNFLGATDAALGDTRPDNTSAIIALQRAASVPQEIVKQNLYQSIEDLGRVYLDFMGEYYGKRQVMIDAPTKMNDVMQFAGLGLNEKVPYEFDFGNLKKYGFRLKLDVGASSYWSEIASMQTLDNLLMQGKIDTSDYLERIPNGYITKREELLNKLSGMAAMANGGGASSPVMPEGEQQLQGLDIPLGAGDGQLQRAIKAGADVV